MHYWSKIIDSIQEGDNNMVKDKVIQIPDFKLSTRDRLSLIRKRADRKQPENVIFEHSWMYLEPGC